MRLHHVEPKRPGGVQERGAKAETKDRNVHDKERWGRSTKGGSTIPRQVVLLGTDGRD
jgi:hypothetical protein